MYYLISGEDAPNAGEKRRSVFPAHATYVGNLKTHNRLLTAGTRFSNDTTALSETAAGSIIIADFDNIEDARAWASASPFATAGVFANITVSPYKVIHHD